MTRQTKPIAWPLAALAVSLFAVVLIGAGASCAIAADWAGDREWSVMPRNPDSTQPGVQRDGTLRILRFNFDGESPIDDQGTVIGWVNGAVTGTLVERHDEQPEETLLEIVPREPTPNKPNAVAEESPAD